MKNNIEKSGRNECCGCGGCVIACPHKAISMIFDSAGYYIATVNDYCVNCGQCCNVCFKYLEQENEKFLLPKKVYVGSHKEFSVRYPSSSGGISTALASAGMIYGYQVSGAWLDLTSMRLKHILIKNEEDLPLIRGSKYIPSYTVEVFSKIKDLKKVMFIGTPCQIYALRKLFPNKDILYVDFRCSGMPGYRLWEKYLQYLQSKDIYDIKSVNFRAKNKNWHIWGVEVAYGKNKYYYKDKYHDPFGKCFSVYWDVVHEVCKKCPFKELSLADIRIEDAWHQMQYVKQNDYKNGFSEITTFTGKGVSLLEKAFPQIQLTEVKQENRRQYTKKNNTSPGVLYHLIRDDIEPLEDTIKKYETQLSCKKKLLIWFSQLVSRNMTIYNFSRRIYKFLIK